MVMDFSSLDFPAEEDVVIGKVYTFVEDFFRDPKFDSSHDFRHVKRVTKTAVTLFHEENRRRVSSSLPELNPLTVVLGALLHDCEDKKYTDATNAAPVIVKALLEFDLPQDYANMIQDLANGVSYSSEIKDPEYVQQLVRKIPELAVVQDADRLDAIGAIGIGRCFTFGGAKSRSLENAIEHFGDKLLKLESMMKTKAGKQMAAERSMRIRQFMSWWEHETDSVGNGFAG